MKKVYLFIFSALFSYVSFSQAGILDPTFSSDGKVTTPIGAGIDEGRAIAVQSDGKILVAGYTVNGSYADFALARYNTDGTLDATFDGDGKVTTVIGIFDDIAYSVAVQNDGKIVVAGYSNNGRDRDFALVRYNTNGTLDATFDGDGIVTTAFGTFHDEISSMVLQSDGKIVVVGYSFIAFGNTDFVLARFNTNGTLDATFDGDGKVTTAIGPSFDIALDVALQNDGKIIASGYRLQDNRDFAIARYNTNGSLDVTFDGDGIVTTTIGAFDDQAWSVALQNDGKIIVAGWSSNGSNTDFALARYNTNGTLDETFDGDGKVTTSLGASDDFALSVDLQNDGKIIAAGYSFQSTNDFTLVRYNINGTLDATFDGDGKVITDFAISDDQGWAMKLSGSRIYLAGISNNDFAVAAYTNDALALPLSLTSFTAVRQNKFVQLNWETASEQNTASFEIERSADARSFTKLGSVKSSGNSSSAKNYVFTDAQPVTGANFYRLKMVDIDGSFTYSKVVVVNMNSITKGLQIFPNPVKDVLYVQATGSETAIVQITDAAGRIMKQQKIQLNGSTSFSVEVQSFPAGKYYMLLQGNQIKEVQQFVKQ
jgi:uncharacterized delta-60 repeat protein